MKTVDADVIGLGRNPKIVYIIDSKAGLFSSKELKNIESELKARGYSMSYPYSILREDDEVFRYFFPWIPASDRNYIPSKLRNIVFSALEIPEGKEIKIAIRYDDLSDSFHWVEIGETGPEGEKKWLESIAPKEIFLTCFCENDRPRHNARMSMRMEVPAPAVHGVENVFNAKMENLEREAKKILSNMISRGYDCQKLKLWMDSFIKPSRLFITKQYRIYLSDYGNIEVKMRPLPKAVFILFLRHPEGLMLSDLQDHRDELKSIYGKVCHIIDFSKINHSIELLVDPFNNSICEKCSAIKSAFIKVISPEVAAFYYVSGAQGEPKGIKLDRSLVVWE